MAASDVVRSVLAGDRQAFRDIVDEYGPCVRAYIAAHLPDPHAIDDLSQETFIAAYENLAAFRPDGDFRPWIKGIAHNKVLMHHRRVQQHGAAMERVRAQVVEAISGELHRSAGPDGPDALDRLRECLEKLPAELRGIIGARYSKRESVQGIAGRLGKSPTAVSSLLFRGRRLLTACMEQGG